MLAEALRAAGQPAGDAVVVGLARGGVAVAAAVASDLGLPLDAVAIRKVGHPLQPEYALGAVTADRAYIRAPSEMPAGMLADAVRAAQERAAELDRFLHRRRAPEPLDGRTVVLVDDGLATGATIQAAVDWARNRGAAAVIAAVPVGAMGSVDDLARVADAVVCPYAVRNFWAVSIWYESFAQLTDDDAEAMVAGVAAGA